jgi:methyl coenzyme M reductase subunit D
MGCPDMDELERRFIEVRSEQTKLAMKTGKIDPELERRGETILGEIMEHQVRHLGCDPN